MADSDPPHLHKRAQLSRLQRTRSRASVYSSTPTIAENLILPDGPVDEQTAELLEEFAGTHQHRREGMGSGSSVEEEEYEVKRRQALPWWKRPSPYWCALACRLRLKTTKCSRSSCRLLCSIPFSSFATSSTLAPKVEIYTMLACRVHKPDIYHSAYGDVNPGGLPGIDLPSLPTAATHRFPNSEISLSSTSLQVPRSSSFVTPRSTAFWFRPSNVETSGRDAPSKPPPPCAADPTVQAAVAKISASE